MSAAQFNHDTLVLPSNAQTTSMSNTVTSLSYDASCYYYRYYYCYYWEDYTCKHMLHSTRAHQVCCRIRWRTVLHSNHSAVALHLLKLVCLLTETRARTLHHTNPTQWQCWSRPDLPETSASCCLTSQTTALFPCTQTHIPHYGLTIASRAEQAKL